MRLILDAGNALVKWYAPRSGIGPKSCLHALAELSDYQWENVIGRIGTPPNGYMKVNGTPYVIGRAAKEYQTLDKPKGAARYNKAYYGVISAYCMAQAYGKKIDAPISVNLFASYAPQDIQYAPELTKAAQRTWKIECEYGKMEFDVKDVVTVDEPLCGYAHYVFTETGSERVGNPFKEKTILVLDVGGYTTDKARVYPNGEIDLLSVDSRRIGTNEVLASFEKKLRVKHSKVFQDTGDLDIERVERAIVSGVYRAGNQELDCQDIAQRSIKNLVHDVIQVIKSAGGIANYDAILLTGGGSALIYNELKASLDSIDFILAEDNISMMKYANVLGLSKLASILSRKE